MNGSRDDQLIALMSGWKAPRASDTAVMLSAGCCWGWWPPLRKGHFSSPCQQLRGCPTSCSVGHLDLRAGCTSQKSTVTAHKPACSLVTLLQTVTLLFFLLLLFDGQCFCLQSSSKLQCSNARAGYQSMEQSRPGCDALLSPRGWG